MSSLHTKFIYPKWPNIGTVLWATVCLLTPYLFWSNFHTLDNGITCCISFSVDWCLRTLHTHYCNSSVVTDSVIEKQPHFFYFSFILFCALHVKHHTWWLIIWSLSWGVSITKKHCAFHQMNKPKQISVDILVKTSHIEFTLERQWIVYWTPASCSKT